MALDVEIENFHQDLLTEGWSHLPNGAIQLAVDKPQFLNMPRQDLTSAKDEKH